MPRYRFVTRFGLAAPPAATYAAVVDPVPWLSRASFVRTAVHVRPGDAEGRGARFHASVRAPLGYRFTWQLTTIAAERDRELVWEAHGQLEGRATWQLDAERATTIGHLEWIVRPTPRWVAAADRVARPLLVWNHDRVMRAGIEALADHLGAEILGTRTTADRLPGDVEVKRAHPGGTA